MIYLDFCKKKYLYARFLKYKEFFANKIGIEIGGKSDLFSRRGYIPVYDFSSRIDNINFSSNTIWENTIVEGRNFKFTKRKNISCGYQYLGEASDLKYINNEYYDFLISSHCIEHIANPIMAMSEWIRVVKDEGVLLLIFPHAEGTFDHKRPVTTLQHMIDDFNNRVDENDLTHLPEILKFHDLSRDPLAGSFEDFKARSHKNFENRCLHQHVFDAKSAIDLVDYMKLEIQGVWVTNPFNIIILAKKVKSSVIIDNTNYLSLKNVNNFTSLSLNYSKES